MTLISQTALAYVNHGRWIADCPRPFCGNAIALQPHQPVFQCAGHGGCGLTTTISWPPDADDITRVLSLRPIPATRNWFPVGHDLAQRMGAPEGQTPEELLQEQKDMEALQNGQG